MSPAADRLRAALSALGRARNSDGVDRPDDELILWQRIAGRFVRDYAPAWADDDVAAVVRELAAYTKFVHESKPGRLAKLGTPAARRLLPTLNRLFDEANSKPGLVPFRLRLSLEGLEKVWDDIGAPQRELEDWLHAVEAFMSEKASTWSPDEVQAIADDLARYSVVLHGGMDTEDFDIRAGQTLARLGSQRAATFMPTLNTLFEDGLRQQSRQSGRARRSASPDDEEHAVRRRSPARRAHDQHSLARSSMMGHPHYKLERMRQF